MKAAAAGLRESVLATGWGVFEHSYYSVITPEGCAAILWKTADYAAQAAKALKLTSKDLKKLNIIDDVLPEPLGGGHRDPALMIATLEKYLFETVRDLKRVRIETLLKSAMNGCGT